MTIISRSQTQEPFLITPESPLPDELIKCHAANLFFNLCVSRISSNEVVLTLAPHIPMSNNMYGGGARSTLGCVVDCAAHLIGQRAIGACHLKEYELSFYGDFTVEALQVTARIDHINQTHASFHCAIQTSGYGQPRLLAEAHGTLAGC